MYDLNLLDETLIRNSSHQYQLSILAGLNGFSFSILDLLKSKYIALRDYPFKNLNEDELPEFIKACFKEDDLLSLPYKGVKFMYTGDKSTLLPAEFFDEKNIESIYKFNFSFTANRLIKYNRITPFNIYNIFSIPDKIDNLISEIFEHSEIYHHATPFIGAIIHDCEKANVPRVYTYLYSGFFNIGIGLKGRILYFNTFNYQNNSDILYFILSVFEQFNLSQKETEIYFSSGLEEHDALFSFLNDYLHQIRFIRPSNNFTYSYLMDELHLTRYANLFNLALCE